MESEILQAAVDRSTLPTCVVAAAKELNRLLASFQTNLDEMTIIAMADSDAGAGISSKSVQLHSFLDPAKAGAEKSLHTQLCIDTLEVFLSYQHASATPSDVTFNLKDFRCILGLCAEMQADVTIRFDRPGQPLLVEPHFRNVAGQDIDYGAELVLATLLESQAANLAGRSDVAPASTIIRRRPTAPQDGRSPNVPGDTPWGRPGNTTVAPRTSRFAPQTGGPGPGGGGPPGAYAAVPPPSAVPPKPSAASRPGAGPEREHSGRAGTETTAQRLADQFADAWGGQEQVVAGREEADEEGGMEVEGVDGAPLLSGLNDDPQLLDANPGGAPRGPLEAGEPVMASEKGNDAWGDGALAEEGNNAWGDGAAAEEGNNAWGDGATAGNQAHWADASAEDDGVLLGGAAYGATWAVPLHSRYLGSGVGPDDDGDDESEEDEDAIPGTPPRR